MVKLELTDEQAKIVSTACEFFARVKMGQFGEIVWHCADKHCVERPNEAERLWLQLRKHIYPDLQGAGHSYGVGKFPEADKAYDVHQVIDYAMGGKREPWSNYDLPKCERAVKVYRYRFKTESVYDYRPLKDMKPIGMPWWCTGLAGNGSYATIVCYLPENVLLSEYWDDAYDIKMTACDGIKYTSRFPKPEWLEDAPHE